MEMLAHVQLVNVEGRIVYWSGTVNVCDWLPKDDRMIP